MPRPTIEKLVPSYVPAWTGVFEGWTKNWVNKNFWKVKNVLHTHEDAMQECALVWSKCAARYTGKVDNPAWFMSLYTVSVANHWNTLSCADTATPERYAETQNSTIDDDRDTRFNDACELPVSFLVASMHNASSELKQVFSILATAPTELLDIVFADGTDETINRRLCRWLGFTSGTNVVAELRNFLCG